MSIILGRRHRLLHVRALLAKRNGGEQEICPVHQGSPLDSQLLIKKGQLPRAPLRAETRGSRALPATGHSHLATEEEIDVYRGNWWIRSNLVNSDTMPTRRQPDFKESIVDIVPPQEIGGKRAL